MLRCGRGQSERFLSEAALLWLAEAHDQVVLVKWLLSAGAKLRCPRDILPLLSKGKY